MSELYKKLDKATFELREAQKNFEALFKRMCQIQEDLKNAPLGLSLELLLLNLMQTRVGVKMCTDKALELLMTEKQRLSR